MTDSVFQIGMRAILSPTNQINGAYAALLESPESSPNTTFLILFSADLALASDWPHALILSETLKIIAFGGFLGRERISSHKRASHQFTPGLPVIRRLTHYRIPEFVQMQDGTWWPVVVGPGVFARLWWFLPDVCHLAEGWIRRMCEVRRIQVTR
jgi:hypothetical protein